ncbi:MAG: NAD(P)/FAD-dependent oxidoreductase, partial [Senegalia sp. (in: firmicutes)]
LTAGGSGGFNPRVADIIKKDLKEDEILDLIDKLFVYYKENAEMGEKLGFMIERVGLEKFKNDLENM